MSTPALCLERVNISLATYAVQTCHNDCQVLMCGLLSAKFRDMSTSYFRLKHASFLSQALASQVDESCRHRLDWELYLVVCEARTQLKNEACHKGKQEDAIPAVLSCTLKVMPFPALFLVSLSHERETPSISQTAEYAVHASCAHMQALTATLLQLTPMPMLTLPMGSSSMCTALCSSNPQSHASRSMDLCIVFLVQTAYRT